MKPKYTAKVYFENGTIIENFGHHPEQLYGCTIKPKVILG